MIKFANDNVFSIVVSLQKRRPEIPLCWPAIPLLELSRSSLFIPSKLNKDDLFLKCTDRVSLSPFRHYYSLL